MRWEEHRGLLGPLRRRAGGRLGQQPKLLEALDSVPDEARGTAFLCHLALADPSGTIQLEAEGPAEAGSFASSEALADSAMIRLFLIPEYHKTFGELGPLAKHQLSHRSRAFARLRPPSTA